MRRPSGAGIHRRLYTGGVRRRWHNVVITAAIVGIAAWGVFALWGQTIEDWVQGEQAAEQRRPERLPGVRRTPL